MHRPPAGWSQCTFRNFQYPQGVSPMMITLIIAGSMLAVVLSSAVIADDGDLETPEQRLSYTIGMDIGGSLAEQDMELDLDLVVEALRASYAGEETRMTQDEALAEREAFMRRRQEEKKAQQAEEAASNREAGEAFLAETAKREGVASPEAGLL